MGRITAVIGGVVILALVVLALLVNHYRDNALEYKQQRDAAKDSLTLANATISDMQTRQRDVAALDAKYTGELANAKTTIDQLQSDVAAGKRRLQLNATCSKGNAAGTGSLGDAPTPRLTADAERNYWRLRSGIETVTGQVRYLQQYIREQCLH